jgi:hypothetical protein
MKDVLEFTSFVAQDGFEYKFDLSDRFLLTEEGLGMPPTEYITQRGPFQHGETLIDYRLTPRTIQLLIRQNGVSRADYWRKRSALLDILRPNRFSFGGIPSGTLRKVFEDGSKRDIDVVIVQGPVFSARDLAKWDEWGFTESLRFVAYDPTFYDPDTVSVYIPRLNSDDAFEELVFPIDFPFTLDTLAVDREIAAVYGGSWKAFPRIVVNGPVQELSITNEATGEILKLNYDISIGEEVIFDLSFGNKTITNSAGLNLTGTLTDDSDLTSFHLAPAPEAPGGLNTIKIAGITYGIAANLLFEYQTRFIGI